MKVELTNRVYWLDVIAFGLKWIEEYQKVDYKKAVEVYNNDSWLKRKLLPSPEEFYVPGFQSREFILKEILHALLMGNTGAIYVNNKETHVLLWIENKYKNKW